MLRKVILAVCAVAALGVVSPTVASARGGGGGGHGGGGGGFHGGGGSIHVGGGGFHGGGGFRAGGFRGGGFGIYGGGYPYYAYNDYYDGGCYLVRQPVRTRYGVRYRRVQVCS
jgi:hypothetical protein